MRSDSDTYRAWTDEEDDYLRANRGSMTWVEIAEQLERSAGGVAQRGRKLGLITVPKEQKEWTSEEVEFIRTSVATLTYSEIAERLGRTRCSVAGKANLVGIKSPHGSDTGQRLLHPSGRVQVGSRTLIAKTCTKCGRLLPARRYSRRKDKPREGYYQPACRSCCMRSNVTRSDKDKHNQRANALRDKVDTYTRGLAFNKGEPWSGEDLAVVRDTSKSLIGVAVELRRTYGAVAAKAQELGVNRRPNPDQHRNWVVALDHAAADRSLAVEMAGLVDPTGIPREDDWDWTDEQAAS